MTSNLQYRDNPYEPPLQSSNHEYRQAVIYQQAVLGSGFCLFVALVCFIGWLRTPVWSLLFQGATFLLTSVTAFWCWHRTHIEGYRIEKSRITLGSVVVLTVVAMWLTSDRLVLGCAMSFIYVVLLSSYFESSRGTTWWVVVGIIAFFTSMLLRQLVPPPVLSLGFIEPLLFHIMPVNLMVIAGRFGSLTIQHLQNALAQSEASRQAIHEAYAQIEQQIRSRTAELEEANVQLRTYASQAEELGIIQERNRMAREIHDGLGHYFTSINMQVVAAQALLDVNRPRAVVALEKVQRLTDEGLADVRRSVAALRETDNRPLPEAIKHLVNDGCVSEITTQTQVYGIPRPLTYHLHDTLYRIAQEGLNNVCKHAQALRVDVTLDYTAPSVVRLVVCDNGQGTDVVEGGNGLHIMRERVQAVQGTIRIWSAPDQGFQIEVEVPG